MENHLKQMTTRILTLAALAIVLAAGMITDRASADQHRYLSAFEQFWDQPDVYKSELAGEYIDGEYYAWAPQGPKFERNGQWFDQRDQYEPRSAKPKKRKNVVVAQQDTQKAKRAKKRADGKARGKSGKRAKGNKKDKTAKNAGKRKNTAAGKKKSKAKQAKKNVKKRNKAAKKPNKKKKVVKAKRPTKKVKKVRAAKKQAQRPRPIARGGRSGGVFEAGERNCSQGLLDCNGFRNER